MNENTNEINDFCETHRCLYINEPYCAVYNVLHHRPILRNCPCQECIVRPVCKQRCEIRKQYTGYLIEHLYEESKANKLKDIGKNPKIEQDFENIVVVHDPSTYDITLRM